MSRYIYRFGGGICEAAADDAHKLGVKGANLAEIARIGLPTAPGFVISAEAHRVYVESGAPPSDLETEIDAALEWLAQTTGRRLGCSDNPLFLSARSGARVSMPGMMDTILNLGFTPGATEAAARIYGDRQFALDCRRRLISAYAGAALDVDDGLFEDSLDDLREARGLASTADLDADALDTALAEALEIVAAETSAPFPEDPRAQLTGAILAVMRSWNSRRARVYRAAHGYDDAWGVGVVAQVMVFGNLGPESGTGVCFTRDPSTGAPGLYGEYLPGAQGEDIVSGRRTPHPLTEDARTALGVEAPSLERAHPVIFAELTRCAAELERHFGDMQDIEFTVEQGRVYLLQTRTGKRTARAAVRIAADLAVEGAITREDAVLRVDSRSLEALLHPTVDPEAPRDVVAKGLPASPGAVSGELAFSPQEAETLTAQGRKAILTRVETSPEDIHGMYAAAGVLTARGGMTSHAAVVARGLGKPCVCGAGAVTVDAAAGELRCADGRILRRGDVVTLDGGAGEALLGAVQMIEPELDGAFGRLMAWADSFRRLKIRANVDAPAEARRARRMGAEGVGLCRTEHGFFQPGRLPVMRRMILEDSNIGRRAALSQLMFMQKSDFFRIFEAMPGAPIAIRLLDPPLHEFLPVDAHEIRQTADAMNVAPAAIEARVAHMREFNPMLGRRGCRVGVAFPEIYEMQVRALLLAAAEAEDAGCAPDPLEIITPFVSADSEMRLIRRIVEDAAALVTEETGRRSSYLLGAMVETPRCALQAGAIAKHADFFSFGTNDLTQTAYGLSRDDAGRYMTDYVARGALPADPFHMLDLEGVGELMSLAAERARAARSEVMLSLCGEHGAAPEAVAFCESLGLDYVSCSPYRLPAARLAGAQAAILRRRETTA